MPEPAPTIAPTSHEPPDPRPRKLRPATESDRRWVARQIYHLLSPALNMVRAFDVTTGESVDDERGETIARTCMWVRNQLGEHMKRDWTPEELHGEYHKARAFMTGMAAAAFFVVEGSLELDGSAYIDPSPFKPPADEAMDDLITFLSIAEERWPEPEPWAD